MRLSPAETWAGERTGLFEKLNPRTLEVWQMGKIREVVRRAREQSPFYAEKLSGIDTSSLIAHADLSRLPFTLPEDVARDPRALLCLSDADIARIATLPTSGRTGGAGNPKRIFFSDDDLELTTDYFGLGMTLLIHKGQRVSIMMSNATENSIADLLKKGIERYGSDAEIHGHIHDVEAAAESAARSDCIVGVPSEILRLCRVHPTLRVKSLLLSADFVPEAVVKAVQETWGCKVYAHYGMTETGYACAVQCDAGGDYHLRHADMLLEIVDPATGERLPDGNEGEVVVTTFAHRAMPLIRYRTGDLALMSAAPSCPCGGILPRLAKIRGRLCDAMSTNRPGIRALDEILYAIPELLGYQAEIIQGRGRSVLSLAIDALVPVPEEHVASLIRPILKSALDLSVRSEKLPPSMGRAKRRVSQG